MDDPLTGRRQSRRIERGHQRSSNLSSEDGREESLARLNSTYSTQPTQHPNLSLIACPALSMLA